MSVNEPLPAIIQVRNAIKGKGDAGDGDIINPVVFGHQGALHTPATDRTLTTTRHKITTTGTLTSIRIVIESGDPDRNLYVQATLEDNDGIERGILFRGYVDTGNEPFGTGGMPIQKTWGVRLDSWSSMAVAATLALTGNIMTGTHQVGGWKGTDLPMDSGKGEVRADTGSDPAAGAEINGETVPTNARRVTQFFQYVLVNDATSVNRFTSLLIKDPGGTAIMTKKSAVPSTASQSTTQLWAVGLGQDAAGITDSNLFMSLPAIELSEGFEFETSTTGIQAGDNYGAPEWTSLEWLAE